MSIKIKVANTVNLHYIIVILKKQSYNDESIERLYFYDLLHKYGILC